MALEYALDDLDKRDKNDNTFTGSNYFESIGWIIGFPAISVAKSAL